MPIPEILRPLFSPFNYFRWRMSTIHQRIRRLLFPTATGKIQDYDDVPTVLKMLIQSSKEVDEKVLVSRLLVLSSAAVSVSRSRARPRRLKTFFVPSYTQQQYQLYRPCMIYVSCPSMSSLLELKHKMHLRKKEDHGVLTLLSNSFA